MITPNELDAMRQAAIKYRAKQDAAKQFAVDIKAIEAEQIQRQAEERKLVEHAAAHRSSTGEWPLEMEALPVLEYQRIRRLALIHAKKVGIVFPKKRRTVDERTRLEKSRKYHQRYQQLNKEKIKARRRAHYLAHRAELIAWQKNYKQQRRAA